MTLADEGANGFYLKTRVVQLRRRNRRQTVSRKIASTAKALSISGFDMKYSAGGLSHERIMRCISLYGEKVIPLVREMLAS